MLEWPFPNTQLMDYLLLKCILKLNPWGCGWEIPRSGAQFQRLKQTKMSLCTASIISHISTEMAFITTLSCTTTMTIQFDLAFFQGQLSDSLEIKFKPDVIHVNDWQTALAPAYLKIWHWNDSILGSWASLLTLHNVAYQGIYPKDHLEYLGLGWNNFTEEKMESYDKINFLKAGIFYSDVITAVSPSFAKEITTPSGGFGLAPYLTKRSSDLIGIINGIDYSIWNPETDTLIPAHYSQTNLRGKSSCKRYLQKNFDLAVDNSIPIIGAIGRFVEQKGFHLIAQCIEKAIQNLRVQFVILGTGKKNLENFFGSLPLYLQWKCRIVHRV